MVTTADISRGMILKLDGSLYSVVEFGENKTARAAAKVWAKLKGVDNSRTIEKTWNHTGTEDTAKKQGVGNEVSCGFYL